MPRRYRHLGDALPDAPAAAAAALDSSARAMGYATLVVVSVLAVTGAIGVVVGVLAPGVSPATEAPTTTDEPTATTGTTGTTGSIVITTGALPLLAFNESCAENAECESGFCVDSLLCGCATDDECTAVDNTTVCWQNSTHTCRAKAPFNDECWRDDECTSGYCLVDYCGCQVHTECGLSQFCDADTHECTLRRYGNSNCTENRQCFGDTCTDGTCLCTSDSDCEPFWGCIVETGECVPTKRRRRVFTHK